MRFLPIFLLTSCLAAAAQSSGPWQMEPSETTADLRGVHAAGLGVVWASGTGGTVLRSQDSGFEWQQCAMPPGAEKLDFRAIWGWDDQNAVVMSSGPGALSRLYGTTDGCAHWTLLYTNPDKDGFWDALAFYDRKHGFLIGDPVGGKLVFKRTADGGHTWAAVPSDGLTTGTRGLFAASNSAFSLGTAIGKGSIGAGNLPWIGTGGPGGALVLEGSLDLCTMNQSPEQCSRHYSFTQESIPMAGASTSAGVFSLAYLNNEDGIAKAVAVGGDYAKPDESAGTSAWWSNNHWLATEKNPGGYRSAVAWDADDKVWITVGPNGSDISRDDGRTWQPLEHAPVDAPKGGEWNALSLPWVVGPHGRIAKLNPGALLPATAK